MSAITSNGIRYQRVIFVDICNVSAIAFKKLYKEEYIKDTDFGTKELSSYDTKRLEDDVQSQKSLTDDDFGDYTSIRLEELEEFKNDIGLGVYDSLIQEEIDSIILYVS